MYPTLILTLLLKFPSAIVLERYVNIDTSDKTGQEFCDTSSLYHGGEFDHEYAFEHEYLDEVSVMLVPEGKCLVYLVIDANQTNQTKQE